MNGERPRCRPRRRRYARPDTITVDAIIDGRYVTFDPVRCLYALGSGHIACDQRQQVAALVLRWLQEDQDAVELRAALWACTPDDLIRSAEWLVGAGLLTVHGLRRTR